MLLTHSCGCLCAACHMSSWSPVAAAGSSGSMADCMWGFCMGDFQLALMVMVGGTIIAADAKGSLLIYSEKTHYQANWTVNSENACHFFYFICCYMVTTLSTVSFSLELQILQMNSYNLDTHIHIPRRNHPTAGVVWASVAFKYKLCFWKSGSSDFWVTGSLISMQCYRGLFAFLHINHTAVFNWPFLLKSFPIK